MNEKLRNLKLRFELLGRLLNIKYIKWNALKKKKKCIINIYI